MSIQIPGMGDWDSISLDPSPLSEVAAERWDYWGNPLSSPVQSQISLSDLLLEASVYDFQVYEYSST